jgi:hypothetical protein
LQHRGGVRRTEVPIEVAPPLSATLDGDAAILIRAVALKFGPQIYLGGSLAALHDVAC